ncbi:hypothetical protein [Burkholderia sp. BCC1993]|uniref:hypothetical protein n=1 Tax=Burkholderia sp. BCC1993 TaxID=2817444 RepID=UPI002AB210C8|nr:hypothetical protein [Burkholderia sp. BCC1993]
MSKTSIIATLGTVSNPAERLLASHRSGMTVARHLLFGAIRLGTLALPRPAAPGVRGAVMAPVAVAIDCAVGNVPFTRARAPLDERAMTAFVGVHGARVHAKTPVFA